jgi:Uma2 family endonuclease
MFASWFASFFESNRQPCEPPYPRSHRKILPFNVAGVSVNFSFWRSFRHCYDSIEESELMTVASQPVTAEEFPEIPDSAEFELVDGHLVARKRMGADACAVAARIIMLLGQFVKSRRAGWVLTSELTYRCFPNPHTLRRPDVSFIRRERFAGNKLPTGHLTIVPDLAVEVISPNDTVYDLNSKLRDYRSANFPLVWVVYPDTQEVQIYRGDHRAEVLGVDQQILGDSALPGFSCAVRAFFDDLP